MQEKGPFFLNLLALVSFIFYAIGIYLHVGILGVEWGNIAVDLALDLLGTIIGVIMVVVIGSIILLLTYKIQKFKLTNIFLCWFWIFSLYQCAINSFLQFYGLPDEPINQFFKSTFFSFWYPIKEICFAITALLLT